MNPNALDINSSNAGSDTYYKNASQTLRNMEPKSNKKKSVVEPFERPSVKPYMFKSFQEQVGRKLTESNGGNSLNYQLKPPPVPYRFSSIGSVKSGFSFSQMTD